MTFQIFSLFSKAYEPLARITWPGKKEYAKRHKYFTPDNFPSKWEKDFGFERIFLILKYLMESNNADWLVWMGADTVITNPDISLESIESLASDGQDLIITTDAHGINNDVMLIRNTRRAANFFVLVLNAQENYEKHPLGEQEAMNDLLMFFPGFAKIVPQRTMNSYEYSTVAHLGDNYASAKDALGNDGQWQKGDFLIHFPGIELDKRIELATKYSTCLSASS